MASQSKKRITVALDPATYDKIRREAEQQHRSLSGQVSYVLVQQYRKGANAKRN